MSRKFRISPEEVYRKGEQHLIENYDKAKKDNFKGWLIHHRLELTLDGQFAHHPEDLDRLGMYRNRPYYELIYLTVSEHTNLHLNAYNHNAHKSEETRRKLSEAQTGRKASDSTRRKLSEMRIGDKNSFYGKHHTAEAKERMSEARRGVAPSNKIANPTDKQLKRREYLAKRRAKQKHLRINSGAGGTAVVQRE